MPQRVLSQAARDTYKAAYPFRPTLGSTSLVAWMHAHDLHARDVAVEIACTSASVAAWASGRRVPTIELARRIERLSSIPIAAWVEVAREGERTAT